ncbi:RNA-binding protein [Salsuginibacillus halophilus]|uniref:RNA-binding protein n=1 Tax=Salsuginibacillus halophilus TaxID=517424 RepID=A0A2P8HFQ7_9BACI|nr:ribosome assembly RNA-binding protein YhbY [Salsuginibacillus halophilus]PSL45056.1 RNA-binding protein [Salsuginibacillus halophilus]
MLTKKDKQFLRKQAHQVKPLFQIGKAGITPNFIQQIREALEARELIKISLLQNTLEDKHEAARLVAERTNAEIVQVIGQTIVLFRRSETKPKIELPAD